MRLKALCVVAAVLAAGPGCFIPRPRWGYDLHIYKPGAFASESLVSPSLSSYGLGGVSTVASAPQLVQPQSFAPPTFPQPGLRAVPPDPCVGITLEELCRRLLALEAEVRRQGAGKSRKPMPSDQ